ncbi:phosphate ABC transporter substrate-binding protein [Clostridium beijerinckii]|uniref:Phosphate-binding protein n=1 Tax=Clostridium beijerinckii TaxID=1520 RepID=A0AAE5H755_CLOBE|nr:phosphate ABC transporter substrate-binding protein [Clostridium beijerinckii]NSB16427.1 phosphate transport system substrate-binding protein [Clostridium beijerinckii]OOM32882.1 phosphate-binding protein PstS 1 precursor [Clostridium beijerinckii]
MKKRTLKLVVGALLVTVIGSAMVGCGSSSNKSETGTKTESSDKVSGSITMSGSSALLPLMEQAIETYNKENPDAQISAQAGGSGTGLTQVLDGSVDVGNSDIFAEEKLDKDKASQLVDHKVVAEGFGVAVSKSLGIDNLTSAQIKDIFSGKVTNWKEVGGPDKPILLVHRTAGSGTRATFEKVILGGDKSAENESLGVTQDSNGAVLSAMKQNDGAISYLGLAYINTQEAKDAIKIVKLDGVAAEKANISDGSYKFWSWGHMYTKGEATGVAKSFIDYVTNKVDKSVLDNLGFVSGSEMKVK